MAKDEKGSKGMDLVGGTVPRSHIERWVIPRDLASKDFSSYAPKHLIGHAGIDLREAEQLKRLDRWADAPYQDLYETLRNDPSINVKALGKHYINNDFYPTPDAEVYASMILDVAPSQIVEIGSGFSTLAARHAVNQLDGPCTIKIVDPEPRTEVSDAADTMLLKYVEDVDVEELDLPENGILFIDSSHITRSRGDIPHLFNRILPNVPSGVMVHVHDVFTPYDYPYVYEKRLYTEQYMLQAMLAHSPRYRVEFSNYYMSCTHTERMREAISDRVGRKDSMHGASFWFSIR